MAPSNYFRFSVFKNWLALGGKPWVNTYEAYAGNPLFLEDDVVASFAEALGQFEQELHTASVFIDRVVCSTWQPDSTPYNPGNVRVITQALQGARDPGASDRLDLNAVLKVRRDTLLGRPGKLAYRGVLIEGDVNASASGFWQLAEASPIAQGGGVWTSAMAFLADWVGEATPNDFRIAMIRPLDPTYTAVESRTVLGLTPIGAGFNQVKKKFYNRAS